MSDHIEANHERVLRNLSYTQMDVNGRTETVVLRLPDNEPYLRRMADILGMRFEGVRRMSEEEICALMEEERRVTQERLARRRHSLRLVEGWSSYVDMTVMPAISSTPPVLTGGDYHYPRRDDQSVNPYHLGMDLLGVYALDRNINAPLSYSGYDDKPEVYGEGL